MTIPNGKAHITFNEWCVNANNTTKIWIEVTKDSTVSGTDMSKKIAVTSDVTEFSFDVPEEFWGKEAYFQIGVMTDYDQPAVYFSDFALWSEPLQIEKQPERPIYSEGETLTMHVDVKGGVAPYHYQWCYATGRNDAGKRYSLHGIEDSTDTLSFVMSSENDWTKSSILIWCNIYDEAGNTLSTNSVQLLSYTQIPATANFNLNNVDIPIPGKYADTSGITLGKSEGYFAIDPDGTYWIDADTGKKLTAEDQFTFGGAYVLRTAFKIVSDPLFRE